MSRECERVSCCDVQVLMAELCVEKKKLQIINILMQLGSKDTHTHAEKTLESVPKSLLGGPGHLRLAEARHKPHPSVLTRGSRFLMQLQQGQGWVAAET